MNTPPSLLVALAIFGLASSARAVSVCKQGPPTCQESTIAGALYNTDYNGQDVTVGPGTYTESDLWVGGSAQGGPRTLISQSPNSPATTIIDAAGANVPVISRGVLRLRARGPS